MKNFDPFYRFLSYILRDFIEDTNLDEDSRGFIQDNLGKHRRVMWGNLLSNACVILALRTTPTEAMPTVITALLAPVMVLGGAWFAISFGGVPKNLLSVAMTTTAWMFAAFTASFSAMLITVAWVTSFWLWPVLSLIYLGTTISCIQYDTADGLKAGLDNIVKEHAEEAITYYRGLRKRG